MTGLDFQRRVAKFVQTHGMQTSVEAHMLDLFAEIGEAAKEVLKGSNYGRDLFEPTPEWPLELGDAFFSLVCVANQTGVDLDAALDAVLEKYANRITESGEGGSGD